MLSAVYSRVFDLDYSQFSIYSFFSVYDVWETAYCQVLVPSSPQQPGIPVYETSKNCDFCVFPLLSTLISAGFATCFLLVAWRVTERIAAAGGWGGGA